MATKVQFAESYRAFVKELLPKNAASLNVRVYESEEPWFESLDKSSDDRIDWLVADNEDSKDEGVGFCSTLVPRDIEALWEYSLALLQANVKARSSAKK